MGRPRKSLTNFFTPTPQPVEIKETSLEAQVKAPEPPPKPPAYKGPQWDYKLFAGPGYKPANYESQMDALGKEGWEFCGVDCYNQNVFRRLIDPD